MISVVLSQRPVLPGMNDNVDVLNSCNDFVNQYDDVSKKQVYNARNNLNELRKIVFSILPYCCSAVDNALSGGGSPFGVWRHHHAGEYVVLPG